MASRLRNYLLVPLFVIVGSIGAGIFTSGHVSAATGPDDASVTQSLKSFTQIYDVVEQNFAEPVKADKAIYKGAIPGMLRTLDPHSNFFDPKDYAALRADQRDHYFGIGMQVAQHGTKVVVMARSPHRPPTRLGCGRAMSSSKSTIRKPTVWAFQKSPICCAGRVAPTCK
jgi:carboxyl-terminal processing protease